MSREKTAGASLREVAVEVAFEQWTEQQSISRLQRLSRVTGKRYRNRFPVPAECRDIL